jgi:tRNA nucleotidyltransferase (CCA-adding enzyme)
MGQLGSMLDLLPPRLRDVLDRTPGLAGAYLVGGCVRDALLGRTVKDFDIEVFGTDYAALQTALSRWGRTDCVGRSFGVVKLSLRDGEQYDFSLPRRDSKVGPGHRGFEVEFDPGITPEEASSRRDFTINALMYDPRRGQLLDFHGGVEDIRARRLRHTSPAFVEDPLRVLRGMQFIGRFELEPDSSTIALCRTIASRQSELAVERIREEWWKWASRSVSPGRGLRFLADCGWLDFYPELAALRGVPQDPEWHPEGDVWTHTLHCLDALVQQPGWRTADDSLRVILTLAVLLHDVGKPETTHREMRDGRERIVSPGHEAAGGPLVDRFLDRLRSPNAIAERVRPLVVNHLAHLQASTGRSIRRLAVRLAPARIAELAEVMTADASGRPPRPAGEPPSVTAMLAMAAGMELQSSAPRPLLLGRHLVARGMRPGPQFSTLLDAAFQAQLDGEFCDVDGAERWLDTRLKGQDLGGSRQDDRMGMG